MRSLFKVYSGGQTGADQAGLEAARLCRIPTGGFAPLGWQTLAGPNPDLLQKVYGLQECRTPGYKARTWANVKASDATIRFAYNFDSPGERCTLAAIRHHSKPFHDIHYPFASPAAEHKQLIIIMTGWLFTRQFKIINIAGNRPGSGILRNFHIDVQNLLTGVFKELIDAHDEHYPFTGESFKAPRKARR